MSLKISRRVALGADGDRMVETIILANAPIAFGSGNMASAVSTLIIVGSEAAFCVSPTRFSHVEFGPNEKKLSRGYRERG